MKRYILVAMAFAMMIYGLWLIAIPEDMIIDGFQNALEGTGLSVEAQDVRKGLLFNFESRRVAVKKVDKTLISIDQVVGRIDPLSLFLMRIVLPFHGHIGGGRIGGKFDLRRGRHEVSITIDHVNIEGVPLFSLIGPENRGILSGALRLKDGLGEVRFSIKDARLESGSFSGVMIPLDMFYQARGAMAIEGEMIKIISFSMEGKGIYARVKGNVVRNRLDLTLEIMRDSSLIEDRFLFSTIENYKVSPGYYVIPIKTSLSF